MSVPTPPQHPSPDAVEAKLEEGAGRYAVFANRLRTAFTAGIRYSAYSSELGEAFRPLTRPAVVRSLYAVSWLYVGTDVGYAGYKAREEYRELKTMQGKGQDLLNKAKDLASKGEQQIEKLGEKAGVAVKEKEHGHHHRKPVHDPLQFSETTHIALVSTRRAVFQSLASMALPAFTVHSIVHYSQPLFKNVKNHKVKAFGPSGLGLAIIPLLPVLFDEPVEHAIDTIFDYGERNFGHLLMTMPHSAREAGERLKEAEQTVEKDLRSEGKKLKGEVEDKAQAAKQRLQQESNKLQSSTALPLAMLGSALMGAGYKRRTEQGGLTSAAARSTSSLMARVRPNGAMAVGGMILGMSAMSAMSAVAASRRSFDNGETESLS